ARDAARTRLVLHHDALAKLLAELVGRDPRRDVGHAAGTEGEDEADRAIGVALLRTGNMRKCERGRSANRARGERASGDVVLVHCYVPVGCRIRKRYTAA